MTEENPWEREIEWVECPECLVLVPKKQVEAWGHCERHLEKTSESGESVATDADNAAPKSNSIIDEWKRNSATSNKV